MSLTTGLGFTPIYTITKGGEEVPSGMRDRMISITVESKSGGGDADMCEIVLDDRDWSIISPSIGDRSANLSINLGYKEGQLFPMGTFNMTSLTYLWTPKSIKLSGYSADLNSGIKAPIITSYDGQTLGDIVGAIAGAAGVSPIITAGLSSIVVPYLNQHESSMHLLQKLESRFDGMAKFEDGNLSFTGRDSGLSASGLTMDTVTLGPSDFGSDGCQITCSSRDSYSKVRASYWDKVQNQIAWVTSTTSGAAGATVPFMLKKAYASEAEANAAANAQMSSLNRQYKTGTLVLSKGHPGIRGGSKVIVAGCRDGIDDTYFVDAARHTFSKGDGIGTTLSVHADPDEDGVSSEALGSDGVVDASAIAATTPLAGGIGHN